MEPSIFDDDSWEETLEDDVEMLEAENMDLHPSFPAFEPAGNAFGVNAGGGRVCEEPGSDEGGGNALDNPVGEERRKKKKKKRRKGSSTASITDINRFVINTCRQLKEKKSYLIWNAVGCLGVSALTDLLKEVDTIQHFGGQKTADGRRFRTGGGVLWNILKIREPKVYREIMAKGKEFEKQFKQSQYIQSTKHKDTVSQSNIAHSGSARDPVADSSCSPREKGISESPKKRLSVRDRIRVPVTYDDDLLEEGELRETSLLPSSEVW